MTMHNFARRLSPPAVFAAILVAAATSAQASVQISSNPTHDMNCADGVCTPTARKANLNATDLANMLATSDVKVVTDARAVTIGIISPLTWSSTNRLTLDAKESVNIKAPVVVEGTAGLTIVTNDGGSGGDLMIYPGGKVNFWDTNSSLIINGDAYVMVSDLKTLIKGIHANDEGFFALANDVDLHHKNFAKSPIAKFHGVFEGLGNNIVNLTVKSSGLYHDCYGLFGFAGKVKQGPISVIRNINLKNSHIDIQQPKAVGLLAGCNGGLIVNASSDGIISGNGEAGGLVGANGGTIIRSRSTASVHGGAAGGLVGVGAGIIDQSYATGAISGEDAGGLKGISDGGQITNSYATGTVSIEAQYTAGGLIGWRYLRTGVVDSYSIGLVSGSGTLGGFLGYDHQGGDTEADYWDLDTSGISDPHQGAGNIPDDPGITGLTDAQLKSGLPAGFDPAIWAQSPSINNGYPYLLANPPPQ